MQSAEYEVFRPVDEKRFLGKNYPVDKDLHHQQVSVVYPTGGRHSGSATNSIGGERLIFDLTECWTMAIHKCALIFTVVFTNTAGTAAAYGGVPQAFIVGKLISSIRVRLNRNSEEFYRASSNDFYSEYVARMLTYYTADELKAHPSVLGPLATPEDVYLQSALVVSTATGGAAINTTVPSFVKRFENWVGTSTVDDAVRVNDRPSLTRHVKIVVPLIDIIPRFYGVLKNLRELQIELEIASNAAMTGDIATHNAGAGQLQTRPIRCEMQRVDYIAKDPSLLKLPSAGGPSDFISVLVPEVYRYQIAASTASGVDAVAVQHEWTISNVKNLQTVFIYQPAVGQVGAVTYSSHDQFFLFSNGMGTRTAADQVVTDNTLRLGCTQFTARYGDIEYPETSNLIFENRVQGVTTDLHVNLERLWYYANVASGRINSEFTTLGVERMSFIKTMPFIYFRMASMPANPKLSSPADLRFKFSTMTGDRAYNIYAVLFRLQGWELRPSGTVIRLF